MLAYIIRRLLISVPLMIALVAVVFIMLRTVVPGDPATILAGDKATPEQVEAIRREQGLDKPIPQQFAIFLWNLAQGDLGRSTMTRQPVIDRVLVALPVTVKLAVVTAAFSTVLGLLVGVATAYWADTWVDNVLRVGTVFGASMPTFWVGLMLILVFAVWLGLLPVQGDTSPRGLILPMLTLGIGSMAGLARLTRATMLDVLHADYIRTARAKGLSERMVVFRHALRNTLIPAMTLVGFQIGYLLGGSVITESIFGLPGMGVLAINAIHNRDYPVVQGDVLFIAGIYLIVNLVVDVLYAFFDPRIRYG